VLNSIHKITNDAVDVRNFSKAFEVRGKRIAQMVQMVCLGRMVVLSASHSHSMVRYGGVNVHNVSKAFEASKICNAQTGQIGSVEWIVILSELDSISSNRNGLVDICNISKALEADSTREAPRLVR
jgi:hypothetical protein